MLSSHKLLLSIALALLVSFHADGQSQQPKQPVRPNAGNQQQGTADNSQQSPATDQRGTERAPLTVKLMNTGKNDAETAQEAEQIKKRDDNEWWTRLLTMALIGIGLLQLVVFSIQAYFLRGTIKEMRDGSERQVRAYVFVHDASIGNVAVPIPPPGMVVNPQHRGFAWLNKPDVGPIIKMNVKNFGQTPAYEVTHYHWARVREYPLTSELSNKRTSSEITKLNIGPSSGTAKTITMPRLTADELAGLFDGTRAVYIYGEISYKDVFGAIRHTKYRMMHDNKSGPIGISDVLVGCDDGNDAD